MNHLVLRGVVSGEARHPERHREQYNLQDGCYRTEVNPPLNLFYRRRAAEQREQPLDAAPAQESQHRHRHPGRNQRPVAHAAPDATADKMHPKRRRHPANHGWTLATQK
ncbi:MAG: hypothetical protein FD129_3181 [bacterium]|nr:MAG: hypothetical protein FD129_3181 [bacterium]